MSIYRIVVVKCDRVTYIVEDQDFENAERRALNDECGPFRTETHSRYVESFADVTDEGLRPEEHE